MKNYSKNYFKTKFTQDVLGEEVDNSTKILINDAITKHNNINEGYSPHGRDRGSVTTDARVEYIKQFTNFIRKEIGDSDISWTTAKSIHNELLEQSNQNLVNSSYVFNFMDFINSETTKNLFANEEHEEKKASFKDDLNESIDMGVRKPDEIVLTSHGDNFSRRDILHNAADNLEHHMNKPVNQRSKTDTHKLIATMKRYLPSDNVSALINKHFPNQN